MNTFVWKLFVKTCSFSLVEAELADVIPVVHTSVAATRIVGRVSVGNRYFTISGSYMFVNEFPSIIYF